MRLIKKTVQRQRTEEKLAVLGIGDLKLDPVYVDLAVPETIFYRKSQSQKQAVLKKFFSQGVKAPHEVLPNEDDEEEDDNFNPLSITARESGIVRVPFSVLTQIFQKAGALIGRKKEAIVAAPGANAVPEHYVESERGSPHAVKTKTSRRLGSYYECDSHCIHYAAYSLCAHTIAVAELEENTQTFINWYKVNKQKPPSISTLSQMDLPAGRGTKRTKSTQVRKGSANSNKRVKTVVEGYTEHNSRPATAITESSASHTQMQTQTQVSFLCSSISLQ